ncbi:hypothetical protein P5673_029541 [Acropora cervicornis]|uniref:Uncharacterized protein n=1 Tax=Acropora cervicornis TaxID=6130 RepID=A0AAD9PW49_ACRCE|nr:hypothetical protein P5673_029541 [Acropora cervicornis]
MNELSTLFNGSIKVINWIRFRQEPVGATCNSYRSIVFAYNRALHVHGYLMIEMNKRASAKSDDVEKLRQT